MANLLAIVSYKVFPAHMGGQKGVVKFYEHLRKHHSIHMAVSFDNEISKASIPAKKNLYPHRQMARNLLRLSRLRRKIREEKIDCVIAEHSYTGWIALLLKKLTGKPFIIHSHNIEASRFRQMGKRGWRLYRHYEGWIHRKADFNFFKTEEEQQTAQEQFSLNASKCAIVPYGIEDFRRVAGAREKLRDLYGIESTYLFYFNGTLDYKPNEEAVEKLIDTIYPLLEKKGIDYTLLISGKGLHSSLQEKIKQTKNIHYLGFAEDVEMLYQASTLFLNPVINNSGVKTKVMEALGNHCTVVSTRSGATGISKELCGSKLKIAEDGDWDGFVNGIVDCLSQPASETPFTFFDTFSWNNIALKAAEKIELTLSHA